MEKEPTSGSMELSTPGIGFKIKFRVKVLTTGLMVEFMWANGQKILCMEGGCILGPMVDVMRENT